ncbi:unnamed protein product [Phytomonas sp. EM1]|nr:unnamed protein product [Phytomonas sp. EM1]|eukprot:CCW61668.1 unnamed protein product [Phytomonas sp. isolate EM1]
MDDSSSEEETMTEDETDDDEDDSEALKENYLSFSVPSLGSAWEGHRLMCAHAYRSFLLIGTNQGAVGVLDPTTMATRSVYMNHKEPISDTSCNSQESFIGSSDKSGVLAVQNVHNRADVWRKQMSFPIQSLALHPSYAQLEDRPIICAGEDQVFLITRIRFLSSRRCVLLHEGQGRVFRVRWSPAGGEFVAWLTDRGIAVLHYGSRSLLQRVARPEGCAGLELYPATLLWETPEGLLCGWGSWVQEVHIRAAGGHSPSRASTIPTKERLTAGKALFQIESPAGALRPGGSSGESRFRVCGLTPFGTERYLILACIVQEEGVMRDLEVCVVRRDTLKDLYRARIMVDYIHPLQLGLTFACVPFHPSGGDLTPAAKLDRRGVDPTGVGLLANDPQTAPPGNEGTFYPPEGTVFFIVSVDTIIRGIPSDEDDHVEFLLRKGDFEAAYRYALRHRLRRHLLKDIFRQLLEWYMEHDKLDRVAVLLPSFIGDNLAEWERWIYRFDQRGESWKLVDVVPNYTFEDAENHPRYRPSAEYYHSLQDIRIADLVLPLEEDGGDVDPSGVEASFVDPNPNRAGGEVRNGDSEVVAVTASLRSSIGKEYYDLILIRCLERDPVLFNGAVHHFQGLFNIDIVLKVTKIKYDEICENAVEQLPHPCGLTPSSRYSETQKLSLCEVYAYLLQQQGCNDEALQVLLLVSNSTELIRFVRQAKVFHKALEILPELFTRSAEGTIELLLEHARQTHGFSSPSPSSSWLRVGSPEAPSTLNPSVAVPSLASPAAPGGSPTRIADPLSPESVVKRLEGCERRFLWLYLHALRESHKIAFAAVAKRHAQLIATLYIEFDRAQLLPFLREMCMYVERIKDICALCKKYHLLEEMVFLMARIGRAEEGLRVIVKQMHHIPKAVRFIVELPSTEDQAVLFKRLLELVGERNAELPMGADGQRYLLHNPQPGETYAAIARQYDVEERALREANRPREAASPSAFSSLPKLGISREEVGGNEGETETADSLPPSPCVVPLQLFSALLRVAADPALCESHPVIDAARIIRRLPPTERIAHLGEFIAAIVRARAENRDSLATVLQVLRSELVAHHGELLARRTAALRVVPASARCAFCRLATAREGGVVFGCGHFYHSSCVLRYLAADDMATTDLAKVDPEDFFAHPMRYSKAQKEIPYCCLCVQSRGGLLRY